MEICPQFDPVSLITECRDLGNAHFAAGDYLRAEEAYTLGWSMYQMYPADSAKTAGFGCLVGLADVLRAQEKHNEAEELIRINREQRKKIA